MLFLAQSGWGQLQFALEVPEATFPPTTVDSTSSMTFIVINELSLPQEVSVSGIGLPFEVTSDIFTIPANDTVGLPISFTPLDVSTYTDTIFIVGDVFGADTLVVAGEGTLPEISLESDSVAFETVSINSTHTRQFQIVNTGVGTLVIGEIASSSAEFSSIGGQEIAEGDTGVFNVTFYSELANYYEATLSIYSSDPLNSVVELQVSANAISEIGGSICGNLSLINSPYVFTGDVLVPEDCELTIEPGVVVDLNGYVLNVLGSMDATGLPDARITIQNGQVQLSQSHFNTEYTDYSNNASLNLVNRETVYFNDFEDGNQPFYCYSEGWGGNSSGEGSYHCNDFYNQQELTWSSNGLRCLRFLSDNYNGYLQLNNEITDLPSGLYQWSFLYKQSLAENQVRLKALFQLNGGAWQEFYYSPEDSYCQAGEQFSGFSEFIEVPEGGSLNIRFKHYLASSSSCYDDAMSFLDDIRLDRVTELPIESMIFSNQATLGGSSTSSSSGVAIAGASFAYGAVGTSLQLQTGIGQAVSHWVSRPLSVHSDKIYIDFWEQVTTADQNCWYYTHYRVNEGEWILLREDHGITCGDGSIGVHSWEKRQFILENLNFGDQVEFKLQIEAYDIGNPIYRDVTIYIDEFRVREDFSQPVALKALNPSSITINESTIVGDCLFQGDSLNFNITNSDIEGVYVEGGQVVLSADSSVLHKVDMAYSGCSINLNASTISDETGNGVYMGSESVFTAHDANIENCGGSGITVGPNSSVNLDYSFIINNGGDGAELGLGSSIQVNNTLIGFNLGYGINSAGSADVDYSVLRGNGKQGLLTAQFSTVDNSILWFNDGVPQMLTDNVYAVSYSNVQGINALLTSSSFAWGDGCIGTDPVFADSVSHLDPFSPCVDGGKPWEQDAHIPMGLGSSRADMGMYGGPQNAFWGGEAPPDGSVVITDVFDIPNDQGGELGIQFSASPFDFGGLGFNVTHYSIWRDLQVASDSLVDVANGNWEQIGTVPAQGFNQYGFTAETLVNSNPGNPACMTNFIVLAHTTDENIYWVSAVAGACAVDNLAPAEPELNGMVVEDTDLAAQIHWPSPPEPDYAYTEVSSDAGFEATLNNDTLVVDNGLIAGLTYTYTVQHFDINGNASLPATLSLTAESGSDRIPLNAGWNLVSSDRSPAPAGISGIAASLEPGNLAYITGFDGSVEFYDPAGWDFLNTMDEWTAGRGYWVKVSEPDTLEIAGTPLPEDFLPSLATGWNLVAYPGVQPAAPSAFFTDLIEADNLVYVTGFNGGSRFFDPNGLPFLNTLTALDDGLGYWVKVLEGSDEAGGNAPVLDKPMGLVMNGLSNLPAGETVQVVDANGSVVAQLPVLPGGHLMTTGLSLAGLETELCFEWKGEVAEDCITYAGGAMEVQHLDLHFETARQPLTAMPNPFQGGTLRLEWIVAEPGDVHFELLDAAGRVLAERVMNASALGEQVFEWPLGTVAPGLYTCRATGERGVLGTTTILSVD